MKKNLNSFNPFDWLDQCNVGQDIASNNKVAEIKVAAPDTLHQQVYAIARMLCDRGIDITNGYGNWRRLGFALADELGEEGRELFHSLSRLNNGYNQSECDRQYSAFLKSNGSGITIKTFFQMAKDAGIDICEVAREACRMADFLPVSPNCHSGKKSDGQTEECTSIEVSHTDIVDVDSINDSIVDSGDESFCQGGKMAKVAKTDDDGTELSEDYLPTIMDQLRVDELPALIQRAVTTQTDTSAQDMMMLATVGMLSAVMPNYYGIYDGRKVYAPHYLVVPAPAASGKGDIIVCRHLVEPIEASIRSTNDKEMETYQKELAAWNALDKAHRTEASAPKEPPYRSLFISANSSTTAMCQALADNNGSGLIFETEGNTMANTIKTEYGDYSDALCKAFQHEPISYTRRKEKEHVNVGYPRLAVVVTMTPGQVSALIPSYESGLGSRFSFYNLPRKLYWRNVFEQKEKTNEEVFKELGKLYMPVYNALTQRKERQIQFVLTPEQQTEFNQFFSELQTEQVLQLGDDLAAVVRRLGLICFRTAMVFTMLRRIDMSGQYPTPIFEDNEQALVCTDTDFHAAMTISNCLVNHSSYVYATLVPHADSDTVDSLKKAISGQKKQLFDKLANEFTTQDAYRAAKQLGISQRSADRYLGELSTKHHLVKRIRNGQYQKHCDISKNET